MKATRLIWADGRFSWYFVVAVWLGTVGVLAFDYYWRTTPTEFSRFW